MKIAFLTQSYPPVVSGAAIVAQGLAEGFEQLGHDVLVLTPSDCNRPYREQHARLIIHHFRSFRNPLRVDHCFSLWPHGQLMAALKDFAPDVIHTHDPFLFGNMGLTYGGREQTPVIFTAHQLPWFVKSYLPDCTAISNPVEKIFWAYSCRFLRRCDAVIAPTRTIANVIHQRTGIEACAIGFGITPEIFYPLRYDPEQASVLHARLGIPNDAPIILHVGRLDLDKQVRTVIHAAAQAMADIPAHLLIVGDGTERLRLMQLCQNLGIRDRSHFTGFVQPGKDLADLYRIGTVFITASEIETQGLVLLEAAACGLPIVAVNATCIPEMVHDGENGYLVEPKDNIGMAARLRQFLKNPQQCDEMGQAGYRISQELTRKVTLDAHEALYYQVVLMHKFDAFRQRVYSYRIQ